MSGFSVFTAALLGSLLSVQAWAQSSCPIYLKSLEYTAYGDRAVAAAIVAETLTRKGYHWVTDPAQADYGVEIDVRGHPTLPEVVSLSRFYRRAGGAEVFAGMTAADSEVTAMVGSLASFGSAILFYKPKGYPTLKRALRRLPDCPDAPTWKPEPDAIIY